MKGRTIPLKDSYIILDERGQPFCTPPLNHRILQTLAPVGKSLLAPVPVGSSLWLQSPQVEHIEILRESPLWKLRKSSRFTLERTLANWPELRKSPLKSPQESPIGTQQLVVPQATDPTALVECCSPHRSGATIAGKETIGCLRYNQCFLEAWTWQRGISSE